jgi:proteasome accessory factor C
VVVEVSPGGRWVAEYYPHDSADELPDGGLRITLRAPDPATLRRLALRLGRDGRIVSPRELTDSARQAAREALAAYDVPTGDGGPPARAKPRVGEEPRVGEGLPEGSHGVQDGLYGRQEQEL